jgi:oxaloacetate decarboxylase alpha subunit
MVPKESKALLRGEYGRLPAEVNEDVRKKAIGEDEVITCRPADLIEPELEKYKAEMQEKGIGKCEEDVLSYALFPQVAEKFLKERDSENTVRNLIVEDLSC